MQKISVFISYSHADEWLKKELLSHLAALKRNAIIDVWHDRMIPAGGLVVNEIDARVESSDIFLFLVSSDFINSDYCFHKEYGVARQRRDSGEAEIIPVIVRDCDWDAGGLRDFNGLPPDGAAITRGASSRTDPQSRDSAWSAVIEGLKGVIANLKKKLTPPTLSDEYLDALFATDSIHHPALQRLDERRVFIDPDIYHENAKEQVGEFPDFVSLVTNERASIVTGTDRSGKTLICKKLQENMDSLGLPTVLIKGGAIRNADITKAINSHIMAQYGEVDYPGHLFSVVIDDFDECKLPDRIKESIIRTLVATHRSVILFSFSNAPSVLFTSDDLPNPHIYNIQELNNTKILDLVWKWKGLGTEAGYAADDRDVLAAFEKIQLIFSHAEVEKSGYSAITFLEFLESSSGADIAVSSFASCYDNLITNRLHRNGVDWRSFDESKNFMSILAYRSFELGESRRFSRELFTDTLNLFAKRYLSSPKLLEKMAFACFLSDCEDDCIQFKEEYLWYFFCARYVARELSREDSGRYIDFLDNSARNIFQKKFANIMIFVAYFSNDNTVVEMLLETVDRLFSKADSWVLTDKSRELMLGIAVEDQSLAPTDDQPSIAADSDVTQNRIEILREKINDIVADAQKVVARYTLPFLDPAIEDSEFIDEIQPEIDADSYMKSVNALFRLHSVLGQILNTRAGTYSADLVMTAIVKMVQASGRYASLNHAVATLLIYDDDRTRNEVERAIKGDHLSIQEKLKKVQRIFAFWSVYLSQAGLARYLGHGHSIRALEILVDDYERKSFSDSPAPFNFSSVMIIAKLYDNGRVSRADLEDVIERYGENSAVIQILRVALHIYSYYMPMEIEEKQWLSTRLGLPLRELEKQRFRASGIGRELVAATRGLPRPKKD